jgi:uncharacterized OsmC-like protein
MTSEEIRAIQAPIKAKYKEHPETALTMHRAEGVLTDDITCTVETGYGTIVAGLHPSAGGTGEHICSGDMLMEALAACAGVTMNSVATAMSIVLRKAVVTAEGVVDFRGTLSVSREVPVGFKSVHLHFALDTDASDEQVAKLIQLTERYCVVFQTLSNKPEITVSNSKAS